ncbi:hypothetical protein HYR99_34990 [Candidatus Poribacteria bacterium]|nr:hypothetical protein [Candidatus Poribacteria bacterium]
MAFIERGKIPNGSIVFSKPLPLTEGTEVVVRIELLPIGSQTAMSEVGEDFASLPFFGMWTDREDMRDSVAWVRRRREQWHQRAYERDSHSPYPSCVYGDKGNRRTHCAL